MSTSSILSVIQHYQRSIEKCQTDEARLLHCVSKLYKLPVKVEHLQETGIGKTVNSLRKFDGEIGAASKALVAKWKAMVASEEEPMETNCHQDEENNSNYRGGDTDDEDHYDHNRNKDTNVNDMEIQQATKEQGHSKHSSSNSHHRSTSADTHAAESSKNKSKTSQSTSINSDRKHLEKHHKSRGRDEEKKQYQHDKHKEGDESERKKEEKHKSTVSSSRHRHGSTRKEDNENRIQDHHSKKSKSSDTAHKECGDKQSSHHKEHEKHSSSSSLRDKERKIQKESAEKNKASSKERDQSHDKRKHSYSSKSTASSSSVNDKNLTLTPIGDTQVQSSNTSAERKRRRHSSDHDASNESIPLKLKPSKVVVVENNDDDEEEVDCMDSSMGANFADVLGMLNKPSKKSKKLNSTTKLPSAGAKLSSSSSVRSSNVSKESQHRSSTSVSSKHNGDRISITSSVASTSRKSDKPDLLSSSVKLAPLDPSIALELPSISTNYKPMPLNQTVMECVFASTSSTTPKVPVRTLTDAEALSHGISSKTMRTKIYSGVRTGQIMQVTSLFDLCIRVLQKNIDALEYTGGVPYEVLRPVLDRATPQQLLVFEEYNPYLMEDSDALWQQHVQRHYRSQKRKEMESWREMFLRCQEDQERKLNILAESIKQSQKIITAPVRKTQLAFVDSMVKPPRNVQRKQEQYGTKSKLIATPASRVASLSSVTPNAAKTGDARLRVAASVRDHAQVSNPMRMKKAPLMAKTLQLMKGRHKR